MTFYFPTKFKWKRTSEMRQAIYSFISQWAYITLSLRSFNKLKLISRPTSCWHIDRLLNYRVFGLENND